ncbi:MAG: hypothetical protein EZS28_010127 [Streblomastix strix]|uniref:Uncharacterized protein n=1 Tax=Streblomastix strix TaxID=222440 RepID=A0A5J4WI23_9EUKA|nr:MAG: hypothetical protein EZS28_010127 [Streblomastix strix]
MFVVLVDATVQVANYKLSMGITPMRLPFNHHGNLFLTLIVYLLSCILSIVPDWDTHIFLHPPDAQHRTLQQLNGQQQQVEGNGEQEEEEQAERNEDID